MSTRTRRRTPRSPIDDREDELAQYGAGDTERRSQRLLAWAEPFDARTWAIEGADGLGYLLSQQLVAAGERVVDVPATLAARTRVLGHRPVEQDRPERRAVGGDHRAAARRRCVRSLPVGHGEVLRLLAKRNIDIGDQRSRLVCRLHALLVELAPGGIAKEINASDVDGFLAAAVTG